MNTPTDRRSAILSIAERLLDVGVEDEDARLDALRNVRRLLPGIGPDMCGFLFRALVFELESQRKVESQDVMRPSDLSWSDLAVDAETRIKLALSDLVGGHR